jgi:4-hydroxybenzoate polyprenyltransferase
VWYSLCEKLNLISWLLYIATAAWTVAYDTLYAMQDREDDESLGVKSTAVYWGDNGFFYVGKAYDLMLFLFAVIGFNIGFSMIFYVFLAFLWFATHRYLECFEINISKSYEKVFQNNILLSIILVIAFLTEIFIAR